MIGKKLRNRGVCHESCKEDGGGPTEVVLQGKTSNCPKLRKTKVLGGERWRLKGVEKLRQVRIRKASESELTDDVSRSVKCRQNRAMSRSTGQIQRKPVYWLSGDRHKGSASLIQAFLRNVRSCATMQRENRQAKEPRAGKYRSVAAAAERCIVVKKPVKIGGAKATCLSALLISQLARLRVARWQETGGAYE